MTALRFSGLDALSFEAKKHTLWWYGNFTETNESIQSVMPHAMPAIDTSLNDWFNSDCLYECDIAQSLDSCWENTWDWLQASILPWLSQCFQNHYLAAGLSQLPLSKVSRSDIFLFKCTNIQWIAHSCHRTKQEEQKHVHIIELSIGLSYCLILKAQGCVYFIFHYLVPRGRLYVLHKF